MIEHDVTHRIAAAGRSFQRQAAVAFALRTLKYVAALLVVLFALDVALHLGARSRAALGVCYVAGLLVVTACAFFIAQIRRNKLERVARMLESRDASLGSRLINFLQ